MPGVAVTEIFEANRRQDLRSFGPANTVSGSLRTIAGSLALWLWVAYTEAGFRRLRSLRGRSNQDHKHDDRGAARARACCRRQCERKRSGRPRFVGSVRRRRRVLTRCGPLKPCAGNDSLSVWRSAIHRQIESSSSSRTRWGTDLWCPESTWRSPSRRGFFLRRSVAQSPRFGLIAWKRRPAQWILDLVDNNLPPAPWDQAAVDGVAQALGMHSGEVRAAVFRTLQTGRRSRSDLKLT